MFEQRLMAFFQRMQGLHASNVRSDLAQNLPLMKRYPHIAVAEIHRFRSYLTGAPSHNLPAALDCLFRIAEAVPDVRDQIIHDMGDVLYEYKGLGEGLPNADILENLLTVLNLPVSAQDDYFRSLARSIVRLQLPIVLVIGAGFSYDAMPVTAELHGLLVPLLRSNGVSDPIHLIQENEQQVWSIIEKREQEFKLRFAGWCARAKPCAQHTMVSEMLMAGQISHLISFNWDDLCERAYTQSFSAPIPKVAADGPVPSQPTFWKLHGDVENIRGEWIFPYRSGRIFDSLMESLDMTVQAHPIGHAVIVGYSEWEPLVKEKLVGWLEKNIPSVARVRPTWSGNARGGIQDSAKGFFQKLRVYMELEGRN